MILHLATFVSNAMLDAIETSIGPNAILKLRTGASPGTGDVASAGVVVATMNLPADYMAAAASGSKALLGTWEDLSADATGIVGHFELCKADGTPGLRGDVTVTGGGGFVELQETDLTATRSVTITSFTLIGPNV